MIDLANHDRQPPEPARLHDTGELVVALAPFAGDYAATVALASQLPPSDARRCRQKARGRHLRLLRQALRSVEWLADPASPR